MRKEKAKQWQKPAWGTSKMETQQNDRLAIFRAVGRYLQIYIIR